MPHHVTDCVNNMKPWVFLSKRRVAQPEKKPEPVCWAMQQPIGLSSGGEGLCRITENICPPVRQKVLPQMA